VAGGVYCIRELCVEMWSTITAWYTAQSAVAAAALVPAATIASPPIIAFDTVADLSNTGSR